MRHAIAFLILAVAAASALAAESAKLDPRPTGEALAKAEKYICDIFSADIDRATKPSDKAAIAREALEAAVEETKPERSTERYAALTLARRLAIESRDRATAFSASCAIAERYQPESADNPREKGDQLWKSAMGKQGADRLKVEAEAAEWYAYAVAGLPDDNFTRRLIERRLGVSEAVPVASNPNYAGRRSVEEIDEEISKELTKEANDKKATQKQGSKEKNSESDPDHKTLITRIWRIQSRYTKNGEYPVDRCYRFTPDGLVLTNRSHHPDEPQWFPCGTWQYDSKEIVIRCFGDDKYKFEGNTFKFPRPIKDSNWIGTLLNSDGSEIDSDSGKIIVLLM